MKKRVLIIGNSAKEYALAKKMSETCEVYAVPGNDAMKEFATCQDIRETSSRELLEFALENGIDITIPVSEQSLQTDIVKLFTKHNLQIFAPDVKTLEYINDKFTSKKIMYKLGIPTPKFGIFEKQNAASDYIKGMKPPFVLKTNSPSSAVILTSLQSAKSILDSIFTEQDSAVLAEEYIYGTPFCLYAITDGYNALPIGSSIIYRHSLDGEGGQLTSGMGACSPNYKLSFEDEKYLMNSVIYPTLDYLERNIATYMGILGINGIITSDGKLQILGYENFMQNADCAGILELIDMDLYSLFESCIVGSFSDEISYIDQKDLYATSVALNCVMAKESENVIQSLDNLDENTLVSYTNNVCKNKYLELEAKPGTVMVITALAGTLSASSKKAYEEVKEISFKGMKYRHDIGKYADRC